MNVILDLETVATGEKSSPVLPPKPTLADVKVGNRKGDVADAYRMLQLPDLIEGWKTDCDELILKAEAKWRKEALIPHKCQVVAWALTIDGEIIRSGCDKSLTEETLLQMLESVLKGLVHSPHEITWVGANIRNFDLVILRQRAWKFKLVWLEQALSVPSTQIFDLIDVFTGSKGKDYLVSKDDMCEFFGLENKDDVDGSMVQDLFEAGEYDKIVAHCVNDVEKEYELFKIMS